MRKPRLHRDCPLPINRGVMTDGRKPHRARADDEILIASRAACCYYSCSAAAAAAAVRSGKGKGTRKYPQLDMIARTTPLYLAWSRQWLLP